jgi:hypothetical protein
VNQSTKKGKCNVGTHDVDSWNPYERKTILEKLYQKPLMSIEIRKRNLKEEEKELLEEKG